MKREYLEITLKEYLDELYKFCPYFEEYLELNNNIASYLLDIYDRGIVPQSGEYQQEFDENASILLAHEILTSISPSLATEFLELIKHQQIYFISKEEQPFSCTYGLEGASYSSVNDHHNICTVICLIHEFFHNVHLDKYNGDMNNIEWFFYTEIFGLMSDLYSVFYLLREKKELESEVKNYLCMFFESVVACSDKCLLTGTIIDIYKKKQSLSSKAIKEYVKERGLSKEAENILSLMNEEDDDYEYVKEVPYIFAFPVAFQLAANTLLDLEYKSKFVEMFDKIATYEPYEWLKVLDVSNHIDEPNMLYEVMNVFCLNLKDIYSVSNMKIKKIGEL